MLQACLALLLLLSSIASSAAAQEDVQAQLTMLNQEMEQTKGALADLSKKIGELRIDLSTAQRGVAELKAQAEQAQREVVALAEQRTALDREIASLDYSRDKLADLMRRRVRMLYMRRDEKPMQQILSVAGVGDVAKSVFYFSKIRQADQAALEELKAGTQRSAIKRSQVAQIESKQRTARGRLEAKQAALKAKLSERQRLMDELKAQQTSQEEGLLRLKAQALRLESVLVSLMQGGAQEQQPRRASATRQRSSFEQFDGLGLRKLKNSLQQPVEGKLLLGFGKRLSTADQPSKGQLYATLAHAQVRAVAAGRVVFIGQVPGVGQVLIIDHGARTYSLYGRMSEVGVIPDEELEAGTELGKVGEPDASGATFYLEFREGGQAFNPGSLLN
ncbi:MAG: peptidoglycan DD-metalloendopeptidase family protein [Oligoflexia bacterium]|nr:peptidoglycan DD-metalloendopeptidase family protein [Oligoflexia bacterium]